MFILIRQFLDLFHLSNVNVEFRFLWLVNRFYVANYAQCHLVDYYCWYLFVHGLWLWWLLFYSVNHQYCKKSISDFFCQFSWHSVSNLIIFFQVLFSPVYAVIFYHAMFLTTISWLQTVSLLMLTVLTQVFVGQKWIENTEPLSGPHKSDSTLFAAFDLHNDVFIAPFHYAVTLLMRLDFREDLRWKSDTELRKIMTRTQPIP